MSQCNEHQHLVTKHKYVNLNKNLSISALFVQCTSFCSNECNVTNSADFICLLF